MRHYVAPLALLAVTACSAAQQQAASGYQQQIAAACGVAMSLGAAAPGVGVYIVAGCATEEAIAKLALDPNSLNWVNGLIAKVKPPTLS